MAYSREVATRLIDYNAGVNTIVSYYFATNDCFCVTTYVYISQFVIRYVEVAKYAS